MDIELQQIMKKRRTLQDQSANIIESSNSSPQKNNGQLQNNFGKKQKSLQVNLGESIQIDQLQRVQQMQAIDIQTKQQKKQQKNSQNSQQQMVQINKPIPQLEKITSKSNINDPKLLSNIILKFKIQRQVKKWMKKSKKSKSRFYRLKEWSATQQSYLQKLRLLRDEVRKPLKDNNMISQLQEITIFPNLDSMIQLGEQMKNQIDELRNNWDPIRTRLAPKVNQLVDYLKIYKEYSNSFQRADAIIQNLKKRSKFNEIVKVPYIQDYLIKPVQRPLQYKLFISQYLKAMPEYHIDHKDLEIALEKLLKIADQINEFVEAQIRSQKLISLDKKFGDVIESSRIFKSQFVANHFGMNCKIYVFNDMLLVAKQISATKQQKYMKIVLSQTSFVEKKQDNQTYKFLIFICGQYQNLHLSLSSPFDMNHTHDMLTNLIKQIYQKHFSRLEMISQLHSKLKKSEQMTIKQASKYQWIQLHRIKMNLKISVVGIIFRSDPTHHEQKMSFVLKIELGKPDQVHQLVFMDYEHLRILQNYIEQAYPQVKLPRLDLKVKGVNFQDYRNNIEKFYEFKSLTIQNFLNFVIRSPKISQKPQLILFKIGLQQPLWQYLYKNSTQNEPQQCTCQACLQSQIFLDMQYYYAHMKSIQNRQHNFCISKSFHTQSTVAEFITKDQFKDMNMQQRLIWASCYNKRIDYSLVLRPAFGKKISFPIYINLNSEESVIHIKDASINDSVRNIIEQVCARKGLQTTKDLVLTYMINSKIYYLDDDQYIYQTAKFMLTGEEQQKKRSNLASSFMSNFSIRSSLSIQEAEKQIKKKPKLVLRKIFMLQEKLEQMACEKNVERYSFILGQILYRFKNQVMSLSVPDIKILCAFIYSIEQFNTLILSQKLCINQQKLKNYLPQSKHSFISTKFIKQLKDIIQNQIKLCDKVTFLYRCLLKHFGQKVGWLNHFFSLENTEPASLTGGHKYLYLGLSHNKIIVTQRVNTNVVLLQFDIQQFAFKASGTTLTIQTNEKKYRFIIDDLVLFKNMINIYRSMLKFSTKEQ